MNIADISVTNNTLRITWHGRLSTGLTGATVTFSFGPEWEGLSKTAVFRTCHETRDCTNVQDGTPVSIPWEVLTIPMVDLMVGVCGSDPDKGMVIPTVWTVMDNIAPGARPVDRPGEPPTPDWTQQIDAQVNQALEEVQKIGPVRQAAEAAAGKAEKSASSANDYAVAAQSAALEARDSAQNAGTSLKLATDYANSSRTDADKATDAANAAWRLAQNMVSSAESAASSEEAARDSAAASAKSARTAQDAADRSVCLGVAGAAVGDIFRAGAVDAQGHVTQWNPVALEEINGIWEPIEEISGQDANVERDQEPDHTPYRFRAVAIKIQNSNPESQDFRCYIGSMYCGIYVPSNTFCVVRVIPEFGAYSLVITAPEKNQYIAGSVRRTAYRYDTEVPSKSPIQSISIRSPLMTGCNLIIKAVRA